MREETEERKSVSCALRSFRSFRSLSLSLRTRVITYLRETRICAVYVCVCVCVFILPTDEEFSEVRFKEREECAEERKEEIPQAGERETKKPHKKKGRER